MGKREDKLALEKELEYLREKLNKAVVKNMINTSEEYRDLLNLSTKLDAVIFNYIKSPSNQD